MKDTLNIYITVYMYIIYYDSVIFTCIGLHLALVKNSTIFWVGLNEKFSNISGKHLFIELVLCTFNKTIYYICVQVIQTMNLDDLRVIRSNAKVSSDTVMDAMCLSQKCVILTSYTTESTGNCNSSIVDGHTACCMICIFRL